MAKAGMVLKLEGFEELLAQIQKAGGTIDNAAESCLRKSAQIMHNELKSQMQGAGVDGGLVGRMPQPDISREGNKYKAKVGYKMGSYDPRNPSDGFKVVFLNYGTPKRAAEKGKHALINGAWVTLGADRGAIVGKGFIAAAKKKARPQIKKAQQETLEEILGGLAK